MPTGSQRVHGPAGGGRPRAAARLGTWAGLLVLLPLATAGPSRASLLGPLLNLMRPQLEARLSQACETWASGGQSGLIKTLQQPCRQLANTPSRCLVEESERSGRSLGVMTELLAGRFGDDGEVVVKRCAAKLLGLPPDSLQAVPLRELVQRFRSPEPR